MLMVNAHNSGINYQQSRTPKMERKDSTNENDAGDIQYWQNHVMPPTPVF